jgi:hypothetical protein
MISIKLIILTASWTRKITILELLGEKRGSKVSPKLKSRLIISIVLQKSVKKTNNLLSVLNTILIWQSQNRFTN